ncbi:MAG TPA: permease [Bacillota bacterium]|nr:permease [Bacillota bacterium]HQJ24512.1 permease [Bacillota bacterium]
MQVVEAMWDFFQNQVLGMKWLYQSIGTLLSAIGFNADSAITGSIQFFIFDTIKILVLLSLLIFAVSYVQSYFPPERTKKMLGRFRGLTANVIAALLGTVTPFCSCSSIPLFIGFTSAGLPIGVTFSFLISSPLVDLGSLVLLMSVFGAKVAVAYVLVGLVLAVAGGTMIEKLGMEKYVESFVRAAGSVDVESQSLSAAERREYASDQVKEIFKKVFWYVLAGVGIGALIHNWIPEGVIQSILGHKNPFSVIIATIVGVPMYADIFGTIPIAEALFAKGVGLGTVLSFMMAVTALSAPSIIMLRRAVKPRLLIVFVGIVTAGIAIIGYAFNAFQFLLV